MYKSSDYERGVVFVFTNTVDVLQVVGAIVGFSCAAEGFESINWPEFKNIIISWFVSPLATGIVGFIIFYIIKHAILLSSEPFNRGYYSFSIILFLTIGLNVFFIFAKGTKVRMTIDNVHLFALDWSKSIISVSRCKNFTHFQE